MKKFFTVLCLGLFALLSEPAHGQVNYKSAIGARLGYPFALSYKHFLSDQNALEVYGSYRRWGSLGYYFTAIGVGATFQIHKDLSSVAEGLNWFFGFGGDVYMFRYSDDLYFGNASTTGFAVHGSLGLDYGFADTPVNISVDWQPTYSLSGYNPGFDPGYGALAVRYILGR